MFNQYNNIPHNFSVSRYNFCVPAPANNSLLLYNASTGAILSCSGTDRLILAKALTGTIQKIIKHNVPADIFDQLRAGGFIVSSDTDELAEIRDRYHYARLETPMVLTVTTTMDCNLGCYYCFEERTEDRIEVIDAAAIVELTSMKLSQSGKKRLHVDWYGGEPLMNIDFLEYASTALQALCKQKNIAYAASIVSNGTCWPEDIGSFIGRNKITQVQISFDGLKQSHNMRRQYRKKTNDLSSFDAATHLVDRLLEHVGVNIRLNLDKENQRDVEPFIKFARNRGWFDQSFPAIIQPARLSSFSHRTLFMQKQTLNNEEFDNIRTFLRKELKGVATIEESEVPDGYPTPRTWVCAALANDSVVIGADKRLYRCGLQVTEPLNSVGSLPKSKHTISADNNNALKWNQFDPTTITKCSNCSFLPICMAGCPKKHLEGDSRAILEQCAYWRNNLPRLIADRVGHEVPQGFIFTEYHQFKQE